MHECSLEPMKTQKKADHAWLASGNQAWLPQVIVSSLEGALAPIQSIRSLAGVTSISEVPPSFITRELPKFIAS